MGCDGECEPNAADRLWAVVLSRERRFAGSKVGEAEPSICAVREKEREMERDNKENKGTTRRRRVTRLMSLE